MSGKILSGTVVNSKCNKTIGVLVLRIVKDKLYKKIVKKYKRYIVHDEFNKCKEGDLVKIQEHRPISATKRWIVVNE